MTNKITFLRGAERVRRRPAVIFGSDDVDGAMAALKMLLYIFAQEGAKGHSNLLAVTQHQDSSIEIRSNDRGIYLGLPNSSDDVVWKELFCELYAGPLYKEGVTARCIFEGPSGKQGEYTDSLDICSVQYASEYMNVSVIRDGFKQSLHFEKGYNVGGISKTPCTDPAGTSIQFKLDREVFSDVSLPKQQIIDVLQGFAIQIPGVKTVFRCEGPENIEEVEFCFPKGIADFLQEQNKNNETSPVYSKELSAVGQERYNRPHYAAAVTTGVCFARDAGFIKCYHNLKELTYGGTHCDGALHNIAQRLEWLLDCKISEKKLLKHLQLVILTNSEHTEWENGARTGLRSIFVRDLTQDTVGDDFLHFVKQNKELLHALFNK